jgi:hypothetical protein
MKRAWLAFFVSFAAAGFVTSATRAATPTVESVVPGIGARGTEFTLVLGGGRLKDAKELLFYDPGLECRKLEAISDNEVKATLAVAASCRIGAHPFRLRTPGGLSELKVVSVSRFPVIAESEPNDDPKDATVIPLNTTVAGVIDSSDVDCVAVVLKKGQRLSVEAQAVRLGGEMTDLVMTVFDPSGHKIAWADDSPATHQDPSISLSAPADGKYVVQIREMAFGGGPTGTYALHIGEFARPHGVFPGGVQAGRETRISLLGARGVESTEIVSPPGDAGPWWDYYPKRDGVQAPTPTPIRVRPYAGIDEPDNAEAAPPKLEELSTQEWPVAFHGAIGAPGDIDAYGVRAHAGEEIQVEVFAQRMSAPLDSILEIYSPAGNLIARNDDDDTHDSRLVFQAETEGTYRVQVYDKRRQGGRDFLYRIEVEQPRPALTVFPLGTVRKSQLRQVIAVPRGNRVMAYVGVRRDGFDAPVRLEHSNLPQGVSLDVQEIAAGTYVAPVVIEAAADAPLGATLVHVKGIASSDKGTITGVFEHVVDLIPGTGDSSYQSIVVHDLAVVVTEEAPYGVELSAPAAPLARDGTIELLAKATRAKGFNEPIEVSLPYLPPGVEMEGPVIVPPDQSEAKLRLFARPNADPASWRLAAEARQAPPRRDRREMTMALMNQLAAAGGGGGAGGRRRRPQAEGMPQVSSEFVSLDLVPARFGARFVPVAIEQGKSAVVVCELERATELPANTVATLEGLPPRSTAEPVKLRQGAGRIEFTVMVGATTTIGEHDSLICALTTEIEGRSVSYHVGRGGKLKVSAPGAIALGEDGKPLSPLEALRRKEKANASAKR